MVVATILSAQTTDAQVNKVTSSLFKKYRAVEEYAKTPLPVLAKDLAAVNFFNRKARYFQAGARANLSNLLIVHGRKTCRAARPLHDRCVLADLCPSRRIPA